MPFRVVVREGAVVPDGYGLAHYELGADVGVCYPVPFNLIVCWYRAAMMFVRFPPGRFAGFRINRRLARQRATIDAAASFLERLAPMGYDYGAFVEDLRRVSRELAA